MLAGLACSAFVGVLGVNLWTQTANKDALVAVVHSPDATSAPVVVAADASSGPMIRDPRLDELMAAHRQLGGHSALQIPAGFLRNATFEGSDR
jgi:sigma-E factor negative regulatory protein RseA